VKDALTIPVIANGGVESPEDWLACLEATGCDAVMSSEGALENPSLFEDTPTTRAGQIVLAEEYLALIREHRPSSAATVKSHVFKLLYMALAEYTDLRSALGSVTSIEDISAVVEQLLARERAAAAASADAYASRCDSTDAPFVSWYRRHRGTGGNEPTGGEEECAEGCAEGRTPQLETD